MRPVRDFGVIKVSSAANKLTRLAALTKRFLFCWTTTWSTPIQWILKHFFTLWPYPGILGGLNKKADNDDEEREKE